MRAKWIGLLIGLSIGISGCTSKDAAPAEPKAAEPAPAPTPPRNRRPIRSRKHSRSIRIDAPFATA